MSQTYTGRQFPFNVAVSEAQAVIIGELLKSGNVQMGGPGQAYYDGAKVKVIETLSGEVEPELTFAYTRQTIPEPAEAELQEGERYLFFLTLRSDRTWMARKIDIANPENVATVKGIIEGSASDR